MIRISELNTTIGEFQRNYLYKLEVIKYPKELITALMPNAPALVGAIDLYSESGIFPEASTNTIRIEFAGEYGHWSGTTKNNGEGDLTFRLDRDWKIYDFFKAWKSLSGDDATNKAYHKNQVVGELAIYMVDLDKETVTKGVKLKYVTISSVNSLDIKKSGKDIVEVKISITWDKREDINDKNLSV